MAVKTLAEQYVPGVPQVQQQTYGQGYGNWQQYAFPDQAEEPQKPVAPPTAPPIPDISTPDYSLTPPAVPIGLKPPTQQQPNNYGANPATNPSGGVGDSWSASLNQHFGPY